MTAKKNTANVVFAKYCAHKDSKGSLTMACPIGKWVSQESLRAITRYTGYGPSVLWKMSTEKNQVIYNLGPWEQITTDASYKENIAKAVALIDFEFKAAKVKKEAVEVAPKKTKKTGVKKADAAQSSTTYEIVDFA